MAICYIVARCISEDLLSFGSGDDLVFVNLQKKKKKLVLSFVTAKKDTLKKGSPLLCFISFINKGKNRIEVPLVSVVESVKICFFVFECRDISFCLCEITNISFSFCEMTDMLLYVKNTTFLLAIFFC